MKPTHKCPDEGAEYIGSTTCENKVFDYWAHTFRDVGEIYLFVVDDNSGSFAAITLPYTRDGSEPIRYMMTEEAYWMASNHNGTNKLCMPSPSNGWYPGMHCIASAWLWKAIYTDRMRYSRTVVHSKSEYARNSIWRLESMLRKAGLPLTDEQIEMILPSDW
jgi:hypothetical protein